MRLIFARLSAACMSSMVMRYEFASIGRPSTTWVSPGDRSSFIDKMSSSTPRVTMGPTCSMPSLVTASGVANSLASNPL